VPTAVAEAAMMDAVTVEMNRESATQSASGADASAPEACDDAPRRGRPRSKEFDESILAATLELAGEVGIKGMSMDELAQRAGVSKATIYRRWPSKEILVLQALQSAMRPLDDVDTGAMVDDLRLCLGQMIARMSKKDRMNDVLPHLIEMATHDATLRTAVDDYVQNRRVPVRQVIERAIARGELAADTDIDTLVDALIGPIVYRRLLSGGVLDADFLDRLIELVLPDR
jgi:AcrR family transcriptional regulator